MYMYVHRPGCKKENMATYVYIRAGLERLLAHTYGEGSLTWLGRNGEIASSSCSWGGNGMRRVHGEAMECAVFIGRQRNAWEPTGWVGTECVVMFIGRAWMEQAMETRPDVPYNKEIELLRSKRGPVDREGSGIPQNGGNGPPTVETGVLLIGRVWPTAKRMKRTSYGRNRGPVHREGCGVPQNGTPRDTVHLHRRPPPASTGYRRPPPAFTGSCSSSLHRALLHRLLFNYPFTGTPPSST